MRETSRLGTSVFATVTLLACAACPLPVMAKPSALVPAVGPAADPAAPLPSGESAPNPDAAPQLAEPVAELPATPVTALPQIDLTNLFPNQGEIAAARLNDQRFGYVLHGEGLATYESNLFIQPTGAQHDFIFRISPGVAVGWGEFKSELYGPENFRHRFERYSGKNYLYVDYSPSYTWYADHSDLDTFDHAARLEGEWNLQRFAFGARASYVTQTMPVEDIGNRVKQKELTGALTSRYDYSGKTSFEVNAFYDGLRYNGDGVNSSEWRNEDWMNYQISPKIKLGIGATLARVNREFGASQDYEQARVRAIYEASEKLTVSLTGGAEWRQTDGGEDRTDGIFELDLAWSPFDGTYIYLQGYRRSVTGNTDASDYYVATGVLAQCRQRLFQRFYFDLTLQYQNADYQVPEGSVGLNRSDNLFVVRPGVGFDLASWANCEISGEYRRNDSTDSQRGFDATTAIVRFNLLF